MQEIQGSLLNFRKHQADWIALPTSSQVIDGAAILEPEAIAFAERYPKLNLAAQLAHALTWGGNHVHYLGQPQGKRSRLIWSFPVRYDGPDLDLDLIYQSCHELWLIWYYHRQQNEQAAQVVLPRIGPLEAEGTLSWQRIRRAVAASFPEEEFTIVHEPVSAQKLTLVARSQPDESPADYKKVS